MVVVLVVKLVPLRSDLADDFDCLAKSFSCRSMHLLPPVSLGM